jgi:AraC family transcriptional regulator, transcriptional activator of pobA
MAEPAEPMDFPSDPDACGPDTSQTRPAAQLAGPRRAALAPVSVQWLNNTVIGTEDRVAPHRHDYHELIWIREGSGRHLLDGTPVEAGAGTITVIGRGQVHRFDEARCITGAALDFSDEALFAEPGPGRIATQAAPAWLINSATSATVTVPPSRTPGLQAILRSLDDETRRPPDERTPDLQRHLLCTLLLWIDRWHEDAAPRETDNGDARLHVRFIRQLEHDYIHHHDAAYYADTLAVPATTLAHALHAITGHTTKELILDRVMLEAARLLRFTDLAISQIAYRCGYNDPLYFSRAFKRHQGQSPANLGAYCGA